MTNDAWAPRSAEHQLGPPATFQLAELVLGAPLLHSSFEIRHSFNAIAVPATSGDKFRAQFLAQIRNMNIEKIRHRAVVFVKQVFVKGSAGDEFAAMQREIFQ